MNAMTYRVLAVEDDPNILMSIEFLLRNAGYTVQSASNGQDAWALLNRHPPDLAVLDVMLPGIDGLDLCRRMRTTEGLKSTPILLRSARGGTAEVAEGLNQGANAYLSKPFGTHDLLDAVARLLAP